MSPSCPAPEGLPDQRIHSRECVTGYLMFMVIDPTTDDRIQLPDQVFLLGTFIGIDHTSTFLKKCLGILPGWFDEQFAPVLAYVPPQKIKAVVNVCHLRFFNR